MARGAVVLIVSDGWDTGDPDVVRRDMERLSLVAYRIVWVNPRTKSAATSRWPAGWPPPGRTATPWSADTLRALDELTAALADPVRRRLHVPITRAGSAGHAPARPPFAGPPSPGAQSQAAEIGLLSGPAGSP